MRLLSFSVLVAWTLVATTSAQQPAGGEVKLKTTIVAKYHDDSLGALRADPMGRLFAVTSENLLVFDPTKDGKYEKAKILAKFPRFAAIKDLEVRGDDVYVLTPSALYIVPGAVRKRSDLAPRKLIWGVPWSVKREGFHTLAWGPEGDLYFTCGAAQPGDGVEPTYWTFFTQPEGTKVPYRGVGSVFRCKPDGSDLRVVAHGLRHPGGLAFDRHWNLFAIARSGLHHVTPRARFKGYDLPEVCDDVPSRRAWYLDEPTLPKIMRQRLVCRYHGTFHPYSIRPRGAGFVGTKDGDIDGGLSALTFSAGRIFGIMSGEEIAELTDAGAATKPAFEPYEATEAPAARLWQELDDPSWQRRYRAHLEITRRGGDLLKEANKRLLQAKAGDPAFHHLIWLAARSGQGSLHLFGLVAHDDPTVRVQVIRALTEFPEQLRDEPVFTTALIDKNLAVQHAAVSAYFSPKVAWSRPAHVAIERGPARATDPYLRQVAALVLAEKATFKEIEALYDRADPALRRAGALAAGFRLTAPPATTPLAPHLPLERMSAIVEYTDGQVDLNQKGRLGTFRLATHWKADKQTIEQNLLFNLLRRMLNDREKTVRVQAAEFLQELADERTRDAVTEALTK